MGGFTSGGRGKGGSKGKRHVLDCVDKEGVSCGLGNAMCMFEVDG